MKPSLYCIVSFIAFAGMRVDADVVFHVPVTSAVQGIDVIISARSSDRDAAVRGRLFFRQIGEREYVSQPMVKAGDGFEGRIPSKYVVGVGIEYYIMLYLADGTTITSPEREPAFLPHVIVIVPAEQGWFKVLYPEAGSVIENRKPQISAVFGFNAEITRDNIQVKLDGTDITKDCEITRDFLLYMPSEELHPGTHVVTIMVLDRPEMVGSWQFNIAGAKALWRHPSGEVSVAWQWVGSDSDSPFRIHSTGSNFGLTAQTVGQILGRSFDAWINRNTFYTTESMDFGLGFYDDRIRVSIGDIFPSTSRLTLDGMPARGGEVGLQPLNRMSIYLVGAEGRLFVDTEDEFTAGLLNSKFGGIQVAIQPLRERLELTALYIHASNHAKSEQEGTFSIDKNNDIFSLRTQLNLPAGVALYSEWARSDHLIEYREEFTYVEAEHKDKGIYIGLNKRGYPYNLELFYLNIGDEFFSEVNPFVENGRDGFGISGKYSHRAGLSASGEYGRYHRENEVNTEMRTNVSLTLSKLPSIFAGYYQQRVPYAKYDIQGLNLGSSYRFWKLDFSVSGSQSITNLWMDNTERRSISALTSVGCKVTANADLRMEYSQFGSYKPEGILHRQRQASVGIRYRIRKNHLFNLDLKAVKFTDKENSENDYFEKILLSKYSYSL